MLLFTNLVHELTPTHHIISCTTLQLHITHGLHFPIPPLHNHTAVTNHSFALITQLHSVWHALLALDFISLMAKSCLAPSDISERLPSVFPCLLPGLFLRLWPFAACPFDPACPSDTLSVCRLPDLSIATVKESALPTLHLLLSLNFACLISSCVILIKLHLDLIALTPLITVYKWLNFGLFYMPHNFPIRKESWNHFNCVQVKVICDS